jgi:hypothetical protein
LWVESDFKAPNLPLSLRFKGSGCHYNSIHNNTGTKQAKPLSKQQQTIGIIAKPNMKTVERGKHDTPNTQIHQRSSSFLGTGTSIYSGGVKLVLIVF